MKQITDLSEVVADEAAIIVEEKGVILQLSNTKQLQYQLDAEENAEGFALGLQLAIKTFTGSIVPIKKRIGHLNQVV